MDHRNHRDLILAGKGEAALAGEDARVVYAQRTSAPGGAGGLLGYVRGAARRPGTVALCALAGMILGLGAALVQTPVYQARAAVEIERPNDRFLGLENLTPTLREEPYSIETELATQGRILTSRPLVRAVIMRHGLEDALTPAPGLREKALAAVGWRGPARTAEEAALEALRVEASGQSRVLEVSFEHTDPETARQFVGGLVDELVRGAVETRWKAAELTAETLSGELGSTRRQLAEVQTKVQEMARGYGFGGPAGGAAVELDLLRQEAESLRALYDELLRKVKEATVAATIRATHIRVVDPAAASPHPIRPVPLRTAGIGLALGCLIGLVVAAGRARRTPEFLGPGDIPQALQIPELACIPRLTAPDAQRLHTAGLLALSLERAQGRRGSVAAAGDPAATASFQNLMTSILLERRPDSPIAIAVSSPGRGDGKSTIVYNLAVALAMGGERVLVLDGDMHDPVQHELFGVPQRLGLGDLLEVGANDGGGMALEEARRSDVENLRLITEGALETSHPDLKNLRLITAGMALSQAARLLHSRGFAAALAQRFRQFDVALIDTPGVLDCPDARIFGRIADAVALVLRASSTTVEAAAAARDHFLSDRTPIAGVILNDSEPAGGG